MDVTSSLLFFLACAGGKSTEKTSVTYHFETYAMSTLIFSGFLCNKSFKTNDAYFRQDANTQTSGASVDGKINQPKKFLPHIIS